MSVYSCSSLRRTTPCPDCRSAADWVGVQALVGDSLRWDVEVTCPACGFAVADCEGELSDDVREELLAEHGGAVLRLRATAHRVTVLRVLRAALGLELGDAKGVLEQVWGGTYTGTGPEVELLARRLREAGVDAVASRGRP
ncbi:hypothetical protein [Streptomyces sp. S3(2020)]|uniref:hypothetical protein n=1 Tax=Streptomyces sp. S3(2020) TaxID=2732044 RepID=UPI001F0FE5FD|nr:hypothetical protein [Streptomyces sp. S3(2020)]